MERRQILEWLDQIASGALKPDQVMEKLVDFPYQSLNFANIDHHRAIRNGNAEVIYCPGKTNEQIAMIFKNLALKAQNVIATRAKLRTYDRVKAEVHEAIYYETARIIAVWRDKSQTNGVVGVLSAGTADMKVAEEAAVTLELLGSKVSRIYDVGVAGIHRLFDKRKEIDKCRVLIIVAGMEGALASVVGGFVDKPIISVPTSVGYGTNFKGVAPLLTMLNSCASGVGVVNIDNGFGAAVLAHRINLLGENK